jgi:hypothetical protein
MKCSYDANFKIMMVKHEEETTVKEPESSLPKANIHRLKQQ